MKGKEEHHEMECERAADAIKNQMKEDMKKEKFEKKKGE